ncbi:MAG TPA: hypothetical protein VGP99_12170, partial [Tepidisphaeraceae bacterium]|nr:hypothetical protein [Tepidisphaeraceae bacterium]
MVQGEQNRSPVGAASAETGSDGYAFLQRDAEAEVGHGTPFPIARLSIQIPRISAYFLLGEMGRGLEGGDEPSRATFCHRVGQRGRCRNHKVARIAGDARSITAKLEAAVRAIDLQYVKEPDGAHPGNDWMKTVCAQRTDAQMQIYFCRGQYTHEWKVYPQGNHS